MVSYFDLLYISYYLCFFFSSRRRHTRCALVTGVQTCALPISTLQLASKPPTAIMLIGLKGSGKTTTAAKLALHLRKQGSKPMLVAADPYRMAAGEQLRRSEERRVGKGCVSTCRSRGSPDH